MLRNLKKVCRLQLAFLAACILAGCSDPGPANLTYPPLAGSAKLERKVLSKVEKDKAIRDLRTDQQTHHDTAMEEISWRTSSGKTTKKQ